ncbi:hypothetical protein BT63DRAFT_425367 [Microthyrium microscopicum]|uniref:Uncharacterized protein n=1 Tax=Microthyrium microscopicum TaxID=703497 RepID=A0A6A6UBP2_9PEZI|nr:hypothetical protein BT63DRAFT_425367 [Microthyrium microscopicum]
MADLGCGSIPFQMNVSAMVGRTYQTFSSPMGDLLFSNTFSITLYLPPRYVIAKRNVRAVAMRQRLFIRRRQYDAARPTKQRLKGCSDL